MVSMSSQAAIGMEGVTLYCHGEGGVLKKSTNLTDFIFTQKKFYLLMLANIEEEKDDDSYMAPTMDGDLNKNTYKVIVSSEFCILLKIHNIRKQIIHQDKF